MWLVAFKSHVKWAVKKKKKKKEKEEFLKRAECGEKKGAAAVELGHLPDL